MKYIVRQGKKRGRGYYLTCATTAMFNNGFFHYSKHQRKAHRFDTVEEARNAAAGCAHITEYRVLRLIEKQ